MKTISPREFYTWIIVITMFIFILAMEIFEDADVLGYIQVAVAFALFAFALYRGYQVRGDRGKNERRRG